MTDKQMTTHLGTYRQAVNNTLQTMHAANIMPRIWQHDHTVWKSDPTEISNRLGWLHMPEAMLEQISRYKHLSKQLKRMATRKCLF